MKQEKLGGALETLDKLLGLEARKIELLRELRRGIILLQLCGSSNLHKVGKVSTQVTGNPYQSLIFHVYVDGKLVRSHPLENVPVELWPEWVVGDLPIWRTNKYRALIKKAKEKNV